MGNIGKLFTSAFKFIGKIFGSTVGKLSSRWKQILGGIAIFGGVALCIVTSRKKDNSYTPSYTGPLQTQTSQDLPLPLLYGTCKIAGNRIWQDENGQVTIRRIVAFAEGEITSYDEIKLNDIPINEISGITINRYYGTKDQVVDGIIGGNSQSERAEKVGSLRNVAYLAITVPRGEKIDINYNLTAVVKGRKIRVYKNKFAYDVKYSDNPAWVLFDFLTCYNGLGLCLNNYGTPNEDLIEEMFDIESFIEAAEFCDELVNGQPRFSFNMIFDAQTSARTLIDEIYRSCRGGLFVKNGKFQFKIDKTEPVSKIFTEQDIIEGSENFQTLPKEEHYDILKCTYVSPKHEWQRVEASAEVPVYRDGVPVEHSVNIYSCTNFEQASRLAWYYINAKLLQPYFGSFQTDYKAYDIEVGDVIMINSLLMGLQRYKVKATSIVDNGAGVYTVNWRTYDERLYSDKLGSQEPRVLVSSLTDEATYPDDVSDFNVVQSNNLFNFVWQQNLDNTNTYEIRMGDSWANGSVIKTGITENKFAIEIQTNGIFKFWIKAKNSYNYSKKAILDVVSVDAVPSMNEIVKLDILEEMNGTFDENTVAYNCTLKLRNEEIFWQSSEESWSNNSGCYQYKGIWGCLTATKQGVYESQVYDLGFVLESIVSFNLQYFSADQQSDVLLEWAFSNDNETFSEWKIMNTGSYSFRYCKFRITIRAINNVQTVLSNLTVSIDVPDKDLDMELEIIDPQGLTVDYSFINTPSIVATVNDNNDAYVVVSEKTNSYAILKAYTNAGQLTTCKLSLRAKGY